MGSLFRPVSCGLLLTLAVLCVRESFQTTWPQPHKQYSSRPPTGAPYCRAGVIPFCPTGIKPNFMPTYPDTDTFFVYAMKAPVWEFKFGDLLGKFHIMHDAIGFHHVQSGLNITMEWYELFQLFNCTFPHLRTTPATPKNITWCNQGATCAYMGIDAKHWSQNGTLVKVAEINGTTFNKFANWTEQDNNTFPFYETWTVMDKPGGKIFFNPFDCASWVIRAFQKMHEFGATFNQSVQLNYTRINLYSQEPVYVGNKTSVYHDPATLKSLLQFYSFFQKGTFVQVLERLIKYLLQFKITDNTFYLFYNDEYWKLPLTEPYIKLTYELVPLPH